MTIAANFPYTHRFADGFSGLGNQAVPSDVDALDYLSRVAAADGVGVENSVAMAINQFFIDLKAAGVYESLNASCLMCGARTLAGALVPLKEAMPTPTAYNLVSADYDRSTGIVGDGSTKYLDTNRANDADGQDDRHLAVYATSIASSGKGGYVGAYTTSPAITSQVIRAGGALNVSASLNDATGSTVALTAAGFIGASRLSTSFALRADGTTTGSTSAATGSHSLNTHVFARNGDGTPNLYSDARLAFYSAGSSADLAALDTCVTDCITAIQAAI